MAEPIIRVENLGKKYQIKHKEGHQSYKTLRDVLADSVKTVFNHFKPRSEAKASSTEEFWALKNVSFDIQQGDVVGIIGRNGAGKSTLLKILSRITEPTNGRVTLNGRVASLLEVGTGFHPELTGRENIFLNGSILGMTRSEIARKFDEIVAFAEVEKFLDTPVKRYSSGMYVRLAFAVAAHLEPEILVVDEVLAVGDSQFQAKCMGKMGEVAKGGRTVLFVSHNLASIRQLCTRSICLRSGEVSAIGETSEVLAKYSMNSGIANGDDLRDWPDRDPNATGEARIVRFSAYGPNESEPSTIRIGQGLKMSMEVDFLSSVCNPTFGVLFFSTTGEPLLDVRCDQSERIALTGTGKISWMIGIESIGLYPGEYILSPWVADSTSKNNIDWVKNVFLLLVTPSETTPDYVRTGGIWGKYWTNSTWVRAEYSSVSP